MIRTLLTLLIACVISPAWGASLGLGPSSGSSDPTLGGDLSGTASAATVAKVNGVALGTMSTTAGKIVAGTGSAIASLTMSGEGSIDSSGVFTLGNIAASKITSGTLALARGGLAQDLSSAGNGKLLIGTGSGLSLANLTAGSGETITNASGAITVGPKSWVIGCDCSQHSHTGDANAATVLQITIPAGTLATNTALDIRTFWSFTNNSNNKTMSVKTGSTSWMVSTQTTGATLMVPTFVWSRGASSQIYFANNNTTGAGASSNAVGTAAIDFSAQQTIDFIIQNANSGDTCSLEAAYVRLVAP